MLEQLTQLEMTNDTEGLAMSANKKNNKKKKNKGGGGGGYERWLRNSLKREHLGAFVLCGS